MVVEVDDLLVLEDVDLVVGVTIFVDEDDSKPPLSGTQVAPKSPTLLKLSATFPAPLPRLTSNLVFCVWLASSVYEAE